MGIAITAAVFWVVGLIAIGLATLLIARAIRPATTADQSHIQSIMTWGAVMAGIWIIFGGPTVLLIFLGL